MAEGGLHDFSRESAELRAMRADRDDKTPAKLASDDTGLTVDGVPMKSGTSVFWDDLRRDMADPEFRAAYEKQYKKLTRPSLKTRLWRWLVS